MAEIQINKSCHELYLDGKYNYSISRPYDLQMEDCDLTWKAQCKTVLGRGSVLIRDYCEDGIRHVVRCFNPSILREYKFNVFNTTVSPPDAANAYEGKNTTLTPDSPESQSNIYIFIAIVILVGIGVLIVLIGIYKKPRWRVGVWERLVCGCRKRTDENNRSNIPLEDIEVGGTQGETQPLNTTNTESDEGRASESK